MSVYIYGDLPYGSALYGLGEGGVGEGDVCTLRELMDEMATAIRTAIAAAATGVDVQVEPRLINNPTTPSIDLYPGQDPMFEESTAGFVDVQGALRFTVRARVHPNDHDAGQDFLVDLMDDRTTISVVNALLAYSISGGCAGSMHLESLSGFVLIPSTEGEAYLGCLWRFLVIRAEH